MARNTQREQNLENQEPSLMPSPQPQDNPVSLVGPPAQVQQWGPTPDIVIDVVATPAAMVPDPTPVVAFGDNGSIIIN